MIKFNTFYITMLLGSSLFIGSGCSGWLDVKPYDKVSEDELLQSEAGFQKLLNGVYIGLNNENVYGQALTVEMIEVMGGAYNIGTDNAVWGNYIDLSNYKYTTEYWRGRMDDTWNQTYALILNCNEILSNMETRKGLFSDNNYNIIRGEALGLRAMLHFDMLRLFGPVYSRNKEQQSIPYVTDPQAKKPSVLLPAQEVVQKVTDDLKEARILLSSDPVITEGTQMNGANDGSSNFLRYRALRMNYYAVTALLARVYLYAGDKANALTYASEVIKASNKGTFPFVDKSLVTGSPADPDRIFSSEVIFALTNTSRNQLFKNFFDPSRLPDYVFRMNSDLMDQRIYGGGATTGGSQDDYRYRTNWIATGANKYFYKYSDMNETGKIENTMIPMLRLGEMYLIAAESQSDNLAAGLSYINTLRQHRGVTNLTTLNTTNLQNEYIRELYGEGQLFYLYKRMYTPILTSVSASKNPQPSDAVFVVPLPDTETENR